MTIPEDDKVEQLREEIKKVVDPDLHMSIVDLGLIYGITFASGKVDVAMTLTSPACPYGPYLVHQVQEVCKLVDGVNEVDVDVVWEPPWGPEKMTEEAKLELGFDL